MNSGQLTIRIAAEDQRLDAYRLRYECLAVEGGDWRFADDRIGTFIDPWDDGDVQLVVAENAERKVVGTIRYWAGPLDGFPPELVYDLHSYRMSLNVSDEVLQRSALLGRAAVAKDYRRLGVYSQMLAYCESLSRQSGVLAHFGFVSASSTRVPPILEQLSWIRVSHLILRANWQGYCYFKVL